MTEQKVSHTGGRWEVESVQDEYDNLIPDVYKLTVGVAEEQWDANARLIAAAPDLLEAARSAQSELDRLADELQELHGEHPSLGIPAPSVYVRHELQDAIDKAGRS